MTEPIRSEAKVDAREALTEWFDRLDFDRSNEATRRAEYSEMLSILAAIQPEQEAKPVVTEDVRWAVNILLEKISVKFEGWDTMDLWRSDAANTVRSFKHELAAIQPEQEAKPVAWQWRYIGDHEWKTPSGGARLTPEQLKRELPIEHRPLFAAPPSDSPGSAYPCFSELEDANTACIELAAKHGFATGHGDTVADMIREFSAQLAKHLMQRETE